MTALYHPPIGLRSAHTQTLLGSSLRKFAHPVHNLGVTRNQRMRLITTSDGTRLIAWVSDQPLAGEQGKQQSDLYRPDLPTELPLEEPLAGPAPRIVLIHGWLGNHLSGYMLSMAEALYAEGFSVVRLNLRDHGGTAHLNEGMFHNGLIEEATDAVAQLAIGQPTALAGFSLGGNFALRIGHRLGLKTLGICPLMDPALSVRAVDAGWRVYRQYFMRKWFRALKEKQQAFPDTYQFQASGAYDLKRVHDTTEHFVLNYSPYKSLEEYYNLYTLTGKTLAGLNGAILAAADDPIVPAESFGNVHQDVAVTICERGGHCALLESYSMKSYADRYAVQFFQS